MPKMTELEKLAWYNVRVPFEDKLALVYTSETGKLVYVKFAEEFPSFLIGGQPGYGKTSSMASFCCQVVLADGLLVVLDPHYNAPRDSLGKIVAPLASWFALPMITDFTDTALVVSYFQFMHNELLARMRPGGSVGKKPLYLVVDEWAALLDRLDDDEVKIVLEAVRSIAREGRKYGVWVALASQLWQLESTGGSQIRKTVVGRISFNSELSDMRLVLGTRDTRTLTLLTSSPPLSKGDAVIKTEFGDGLQRVHFLFTDVNACKAVARIAKAEYSGYSATFVGKSLSMPALPLIPAQNTDVSAHIQPDRAMEIFSNRNLNTLNTDLNVDLNNLNIQAKGVKITEEELEAIIKEGTRQLSETGKVNRTLIRDQLGWNSHGYRKIQAVCDRLGWNRSIANQEITAEERQALLREANYQCQQCGATNDLTIDHIKPRVKGGSAQEGLQVLCRQCNSSKGIKL